MNSILQYDDDMTKEKGQNKKIVSGDKWKVNASVTILISLKSKYRVPLLHMSRKTIKEVETDKIIPQYHVNSIYLSFSKQNKTIHSENHIRVLYKDCIDNKNH